MISSLPTQKLMLLIRGTIGFFPRCKVDEETLAHALKNCPKARAVLTGGGIDGKSLAAVLIG